MTTQEIDLTDSAEILYQFGADNFHPSRSKLEDLRGYGREADILGGPTLGVKGPGGFEAASLDNTDDRFNGPDLTNPFGEELTLVALVELPDNGDADGIIEWDDFGAIYHRCESGGEVMWVLDFDDGTTTDEHEPYQLAGEGWVWTGLTYDANRDPPIKTFRNGEVTSTRPEGAGTQINQSGTFSLDVGGSGGDLFGGQMAFIGAWSRSFSEAEMEYVHSLTGPVRGEI